MSSFFKTLQAAETCWIYPDVIHIGNSLWYSTAYNAGEKGMVEYSIQYNRIIQIVKYPYTIQPDYHSLCKHANSNMIYIVDGFEGTITSFNPFTKQFNLEINIPKVGYNAVCLEFDDKIYIFNGHTNCKDVVVYSPFKNKYEISQIMKSNLGTVCTLRYQNQIIRFGGFNYAINKCMDTFIMSSPIISGKNENKNMNMDVHWFEKLTCKLPEPINGCGCLVYQSYVITFGGSTSGGKRLDKIYILDLNNTNNGWFKLKNVKCPVKSKFTCVLDENNNTIHLFTRIDDNKHYSIHINTILNDGNNNSQRYEIKQEENDLNSSISLKKELNIITTEKQNLKILCDELQQNNDELKSEINSLKAANSQYRKHIGKLQKNNQQYLKLNSDLNEECKQIKLELKQIKNNNTTTKQNNSVYNYKNWTSNQFVDWIIKLETGKYKQYENYLRKVFIKEEVDGSVINAIDNTDWKRWGIHDFKHRTSLDKHIKNLCSEENTYI